MDLLKALGGIQSADKNANDKQSEPPPPPPTVKTQAAPPERTVQYNPMASVIARHEDAVNRLKRGK